MRSAANILGLGFGTLLAVACQGPDEYFRGPLDAGGFDLPPIAGQGGSVTGVGGSATGLGGGPTGIGGSASGVAGSSGTAGTTGSAGSGGVTGAGGTTTGAAGTTGSAGATGAGGTASGRGGNTGAAGTSGGRGGTTGSAGTTGTAGSAGGATGAGGSAGSSAGRGGTGGATGAGGAAGSSTSRGGSSGTAGTTGTGGGTGMVVFSDDFENESVGANAASGWTRAGGSSSDWDIATDGTKVLRQANATSSTIRFQSATGAPGWSGATSASARVKLLEAGSSNQAALLCVRHIDSSSRYCAALVPNGVQIQVAVNGTVAQSGVFSASVATGTFYDLRISVDASNLLTVYVGGTQRGTFMPGAIASGTVAVGTTSMMAAFDNVTVTRP